MTPLLVSLMANTQGAGELPLLDTVLGIARMLLLPLIVGSCCGRCCFPGIAATRQ